MLTWLASCHLEKFRGVHPWPSAETTLPDFLLWIAFGSGAVVRRKHPPNRNQPSCVSRWDEANVYSFDLGVSSILASPGSISKWIWRRTTKNNLINVVKLNDIFTSFRFDCPNTLEPRLMSADCLPWYWHWPAVHYCHSTRSESKIQVVINQTDLPNMNRWTIRFADAL